jgi:hypothetical protein
MVNKHEWNSRVFYYSANQFTSTRGTITFTAMILNLNRVLFDGVE